MYTFFLCSGPQHFSGWQNSQLAIQGNRPPPFSTQLFLSIPISYIIPYDEIFTQISQEPKLKLGSTFDSEIKIPSSSSRQIGTKQEEELGGQWLRYLFTGDTVITSVHESNEVLIFSSEESRRRLF